MKIRNWSIGTWLLSGFTIILSFVIVLGITAYSQTDRLSEQTQTMYNHPLVVRRALARLEFNVSEVRLEFRNLILAETIVDEQRAIENIERDLLDIEAQFVIIRDKYLGPEEDVNDAFLAYNLWINVREDNMDLLEQGEIAQVLESINLQGEESIKINDFITKVGVLDDFAQSKADELYSNSIKLHDTMTVQLSVIVGSLMLLTLVIGAWLYRAFKVPLKEMNDTVIDFQQGDMKSRVGLNTTNELGRLANSIDDMADIIESNEALNKVINEFSEMLISENTMDIYFEIVLKSLMSRTNSNASALYLINEEKDTFECISSIGLQKSKIQPFASKDYEGEYGDVFVNKDISIIKLDPENSSFIYNTTIAGFIPKEIVSIPIIIKGNIVSLITLASLSGFTEYDIKFIDSVMDNLTSRTEAIMSTEKINQFVLELEQRSNELIAQNVELEMQKKQLNEASNLKSNFLSNMSHELRTPLNSVIALTGVLYEKLKGQISNEEYSYLEIIGRNGRNLLDLINDILDISRIESGKVELEISKFNVTSLITETISLFSLQAQEKGIKLEHYNRDTEIQMNSDMDKLRHVMQNLLSNAVKFTKTGKVSIEAEESNNGIVIIVKDTGIGISESNLDTIFEEFRQAESGTSRKYGGTGLGLSIVKNYITLLRGNISVTSKIGSGSTFRIELPKDFEEEISTLNVIEKSTHFANYNNTVPTSNFNNKTVLLIEDNEAAIIQIKDLVQGMGVQIEVAENGQKGLDLLNKIKVDAIILDLMMPGKDGFEVLIEIRNNDKTAHIPVLILTAKHITKKDLSVLKRNNVHQLIQKGNIDRIELQTEIFNMIFNNDTKPTRRISKSIKPKILIVEDNPDNRITINALLADFGELINAVDGAEGVELAKKHNPDLVLMDIALPKVNGIEAFHQIKNIEGLDDIPIIAITASALETEKDKILAHGFNGFIPKPIIAEELFAVLRSVLYDD